MPKPICLITGATDGIGKAPAAELAAKGFTVVLAARNTAKAEAVKAEIVAANGGEVDILQADLTSLTAVRQLAETFKARYPRLDVLINNAGVFMPTRKLTEDGFEATYQINYLSGFLLTQLLLGALERSPQGRIINLSSSVYEVGKFDGGNLQSEKGYSVFGAYAASKLFVLLSSLEQAERLKTTAITVNAVHPGVVRTQMMLRAPGAFRIVAWLALPIAISPQMGAATSVYLAVSPETKAMTGRYFAGSKPVAIKTRFNTIPARQRLWENSIGSLQDRGLLTA
jgi:NAD(P)-dependent dehydrogenase (short-subunit alcohol dehydrogenase family)